MKITILEYVNEYGNYAFYRAYKTTKPKLVIERYLADNDLDGKIEKDYDDTYFVDDTCRAYISELEIL